MFPVKVSQRMHMFRTGRKMAPGGSERVASKPLYCLTVSLRHARLNLTGTPRFKVTQQKRRMWTTFVLHFLSSPASDVRRVWGYCRLRVVAVVIVVHRHGDMWHVHLQLRVEPSRFFVKAETKSPQVWYFVLVLSHNSTSVSEKRDYPWLWVSIMKYQVQFVGVKSKLRLISFKWSARMFDLHWLVQQVTLL